MCYATGKIMKWNSKYGFLFAEMHADNSYMCILNTKNMPVHKLCIRAYIHGKLAEAGNETIFYERSRGKNEKKLYARESCLTHLLCLQLQLFEQLLGIG